MQLYKKDFLLINFLNKYFYVATVKYTVRIYEKDFLLIDFQTYFTVAVEKIRASQLQYIYCSLYFAFRSIEENTAEVSVDLVRGWLLSHTPQNYEKEPWAVTVLGIRAGPTATSLPIKLDFLVQNTLAEESFVFSRQKMMLKKC